MTSEPFDPYHVWLGIPPEEQPPNHYRLLGIPLFEDDAQVITVAAQRQIAHVKIFAIGNYGDLSQKILRELAKAKICLLDPRKKQQYDESIKAAHASSRAPAVASSHARSEEADKERSWVVGGLPTCEVFVENSFVSSRHCRLTQTKEGFFLEDLGSTNGTYVNGKPIAGKGRVRVFPSDLITLGKKARMPWPKAARGK